LENNRLNILKEVINQYISSLNEHKNIATPVIISAVELNEEQKTKIINKLQSKLSKQINPEYKVSKSIIGGLIIELNDTTIDCSLKTKFDNMQKQLTKGNNYGNN
jgi:F-type H+-transporting ATPase subunit delta